MRHCAAFLVVATMVCASQSASPYRFGEMPSAHAQDSSFWSFLKQGQTIRRCTPMSPAHLEAKASLARLSDRMLRLSDADPLGPVLDELHALLKSECFWMASETGRVPAPDSTLSLKEWWSAGGDSWLESYLELPRYGEISALQPHIVIPPDARRTLNLETTRGHRLQDFLCSQKDTACGARTRGWALRADMQFASFKAPDWSDASGRQLTADEASRECLATSGPNYQAWRACVESKRRLRTALPLGAFNAPDSGWLVIAGRRGHYDFCDTARAYDLETGTAFISDSCSGLSLQPGGSVNARETNERRRETLQAGAVSIDNLKEALWMMLFREEAAEVQLTSESVPLPTGLTPEITVQESNGDVTGFGASWNSGQTLLVWRWIPVGQTRVDGGLTWPGSYNAAEDHAASLLAVAEASFVEGCPRRSLPASVSIRARQPVNRLDAPGESVDKWLEKAVSRWNAIPICH
jgi:hypothetical protein